MEYLSPSCLDLEPLSLNRRKKGGKREIKRVATRIIARVGNRKRKSSSAEKTCEIDTEIFNLAI